MSSPRRRRTDAIDQTEGIIGDRPAPPPAGPLFEDLPPAPAPDAPKDSQPADR